MDLTIVLTNYRRPMNMPAIMDALASQTVRHELFVWDNSEGQTFVDPRADWVVRSSRNAQCVGRWWLGAHAQTPWVIVMDDDLMPDDATVLADTIAKLSKYAPSAVGAAGVVLDRSRPYWQCRHVGPGAEVDEDTRVDIVKGRFFGVGTRRLRSLRFMTLGEEDDIAVSACLGGGVVGGCLTRRFRELPAGTESRVCRPDHDQAREASRREWFDTRGAQKVWMEAGRRRVRAPRS